MSRRLLFKPDFETTLSFGLKGELAVIAVLECLNHKIEPLDKGAGKFDLWVKARNRQTDFECTACGIRVESRAKKIPQLSMSDSDLRPFSEEHRPSDFLAIVSPAGIWFFRFSDLIERKSLAVKKRNRAGEPYLQWPRGTVRPVQIPFCSGAR